MSIMQYLNTRRNSLLTFKFVPVNDKIPDRLGKTDMLC